MFCPPMKQFLKTLCIIFLTLFGFLNFAVLPVAADLTTYQQNCSTQNITEDCIPPTISDAQGLAFKLLVSAWSLAGVIFLVLLIYNGLIYLLGSWEESKYILGASLEDVQKRMAQWGIGFFLFFLSYPLMNTMLKALVNDGDCYASLKEPGFTFFFPEVCSYEGPVKVTQTPTPKPTTDDLIYLIDDCADWNGETVCFQACGVDTDDIEWAATTKNGEARYVRCDCTPIAKCMGTSRFLVNIDSD